MGLSLHQNAGYITDINPYECILCYISPLVIERYREVTNYILKKERKKEHYANLQSDHSFPQNN